MNVNSPDFVISEGQMDQRRAGAQRKEKGKVTPKHGACERGNTEHWIGECQEVKSCSRRRGGVCFGGLQQHHMAIGELHGRKGSRDVIRKGDE